MKQDELKAQVAIAVQACKEKKAEDISILRLDAQASGFTDYFVICSGANPRQVQAIADEVDEKLSRAGIEPSHVEGKTLAEWVLLDYVDFVVHIFSESARKFYDLERLWKTATRLELTDLEKREVKKAVVGGKRASGKKAATKSAAKKSARESAAANHGRGQAPTPSTSSGQALSPKARDKGGAPKIKRTGKSS
jgi:ribosome-associated protein